VRSWGILGVLRSGRRRILSGVGPLDVAHAEDVTAALLGASAWQAEAFRSAVFSFMLRWWCTEREAIDAIWAATGRSGWRSTPTRSPTSPTS
jgi:hypothetical protein